MAFSSFAQGDSVVIRATPWDGHDYGATVSDGPVIIGTTLPTLAGVDITATRNGVPTTRMTSRSDLAAVPFGWNDEDGDPSEYAFRWFVDGAEVGTTDSLDHANFKKNQVVSVEVTPLNGVEAGDPVSKSVTIGNGAPSLASVSLSPSSLKATTSVSATPQGAYDPDGDSVSFAYQWYVSGVPVGTNSADLDSANYVGGDQVRVAVTPKDANDSGNAVSSASVEVENSLPTLQDFTITPSSPRTKQSVVANATWADVDGDFVTATYQWRVNTTLQTTNGSTLHYSKYNKGDNIVVYAAPSDGHGTGAAQYLASITVVDTPPVAPVVRQGLEAAWVGEEIKCGVQQWARDDDRDLISYDWSWTVDGVNAGLTSRQITATSPGHWICTLTATAGGQQVAASAEPIGVADYPEPMVDVGTDATCVLNDRGEVDCWGGDRFEKSDPPDELFVQISLGFYAACGVDRARGVQCWGYADSTWDIPGNTPAEKQFVNVQTNSDSACGLKLDGEIECWGRTIMEPPAGTFQFMTLDYGQLCALDMASNLQCFGRTWDTQLVGTYTSVDIGQNDACALDADGYVNCWSEGNPSVVDEMPTSTRFLDVQAAAWKAYGLTEDGDIICWGGHCRSEDDRDGPFISMSIGVSHHCAMKANGKAECWGSNTHGAVDPDEIVDVTTGGFTSCALTAEGDTTCWGHYLPTPPREWVGNITFGSMGCGIDYLGRLDCWGSASFIDEDPPTTTGNRDVVFGDNSGCALETDGDINCWGEHQLSVSGNYRQIAMTPDTQGGDFFCAVDWDDQLECWGEDYWGPLTPPSGSFDYVGVGGHDACAVEVSTNDIKCWSSDDPAVTTVTGNFVEVHVGSGFACGLTSVGEIECWGNDDSGTVDDAPTGTGWKLVDIAHNTGCAVHVNDQVLCWGNDGNGQASPPSDLLYEPPSSPIFWLPPANFWANQQKDPPGSSSSNVTIAF